MDPLERAYGILLANDYCVARCTSSGKLFQLDVYCPRENATAMAKEIEEKLTGLNLSVNPMPNIDSIMVFPKPVKHGNYKALR